jgi:hypothetical protein
LAALRESNGKKAEKVAICCLDIHMGLDESLPFAHKRAELVRGKGHAMEVGEAILSLDLVNAKFNLAERLLLVLVKVTERDLDNTTL